MTNHNILLVHLSEHANREIDACDRMVCDFFHPNVGGVENHIFMLSVGLMRKGHKVSPYHRSVTFLTCPFMCRSL